MKKIKKDIQKLVLERIKASSDDLVISIGSKEYSKDDILKSVSSGTKLGQEIMEIQMDYLRDMGSGAIYENE